MVQLLEIVAKFQFLCKFLVYVDSDTWKPDDCSMLQLVLFQRLGINPLHVDDASVPFSHANTRGTGTCQVSAGVETNVPETLDDVGLASPAWSVANHGHVLSLVDEVLQTMEDSSSCGAGASMDSSLVDGLA